jgi:hypothetical protein
MNSQIPQLELKKINDHIIRPVQRKKKTKQELKPVKGGDIFQLYGNIYLCSRKKSGKTLLIYHIIEKTCTKNTTIIFFVSTFNKDEGYKDIMKLCHDKKIPYIVHTSLMDDEVKGLDILQETVKGIKAGLDVEELDDEPPKDDLSEMMFGSNSKKAEPKQEEKKPSRSKWRVPEYVFIFDDISQEIKKSESLVSLLKDSRHIHAKVIVSSQNWNDVPKGGRPQFDYYILFRGIPEEKLEDIYDESAISTITFNEFDNIYHTVTKIKQINGHESRHDFLYIDKDNEQFRMNLDLIIQTTYVKTEGL